MSINKKKLNKREKSTWVFVWIIPFTIVMSVFPIHTVFHQNLGTDHFSVFTLLRLSFPKLLQFLTSKSMLYFSFLLLTFLSLYRFTPLSPTKSEAWQD